jgi:hypothetical protein
MRRGHAGVNSGRPLAVYVPDDNELPMNGNSIHEGEG